MGRATWKLFRLIVPQFPIINIYTRVARNTTDLGSIMLATTASKLWGWRVEVINENNYHGPKDKNGLPNYELMQKENPADIVGFCCGLTSTIERVWQLAAFYKAQGVATIAGGWHAHYCPEETLGHNIDLVVHGDGEPVIQQILKNMDEGLRLSARVTGCSFMSGGLVCHNNQKATFIPQIPDTDKALVNLMNKVTDLDDLPYPDFGLLKHARINVYPIGRNRGCGFDCEFCSVKGGVRSASAGHLFRTIDWLVETRGAKKFFVVDDRLEGNMPETKEFFRLVKEKYGNRLNFTVQMRLDSAKDAEFVKAMADAGVRIVCIGYESPIDEELKVMRKHITSANMLEWTKILGRHFWIHAMFIFGYPPESNQIDDGQKPISVKEKKKRFKLFIRKAVKVTHWHGLSIQIMKAMPIVGTDLRRRLEKDGALLPLGKLPYKYHDGNWAAIKPKDMTLKEFQDTPIQIMHWFYGFSFARVCLRTIVFPVDYLVRGWQGWKIGWRRDVVKWFGSRLIKKWRERHNSEKIIEELQDYCNQKHPK